MDYIGNLFFCKRFKAYAKLYFPTFKVTIFSTTNERLKCFVSEINFF